jgi:hypothetical protein
MLTPTIIKAKANFVLCQTGVLYLASIQRRKSQVYEINKDCWNLAKNLLNKLSLYK